MFTFFSLVQVLNTNPQLLELPDPEAPRFRMTDEMVVQVMAVGFESLASRAALHHTRSVERAIDELVNRQGQIPHQWIVDLEEAENASSGNGKLFILLDVEL